MLDRRHKWHRIPNDSGNSTVIFQCLVCEKKIWKAKDVNWPEISYWIAEATLNIAKKQIHFYENLI